MGFGKITAQRRILELSKRIRVIQGGTSAGKTYSILPVLFEYARENQNIVISVVSESHPHLRKGAIRDFKNIMQDVGEWSDAKWNETNSTYHLTNGSLIEFFSADKGDKLRGSRRDILFINEANNISHEAYNQLAIRTKQLIFIDFNPSHRFWAHEHLSDDPDAEWITLTYKDNEYTPPEIVNELVKAEAKAEKSDYWRNWVSVYVYGHLGTRQGVIFKEHQDWFQIEAIPANAEPVGIGLDFGFSNHQSAIVRAYYVDGRYIFDEVCYKTGMQNSDLADVLKGMPGQVVADSAEPKSIDYIKGCGIDVRGVKKGPDSVRYGIGMVHEIGPFYVTARSVNLIAELRDYAYEEKEGARFNTPAKGQKDHAIDALRYFVMEGVQPQGQEQRSEILF